MDMKREDNAIHLRLLRKNYKVLLTKRISYSFASGLTQNYTSIYIVKLGANPLHLGGLNSLGSLFSSVLALPVGWLADYYSLRRVYLISLAFTLLVPLVYATAGSWEVTVVPIMISYMSMGSIAFLEAIMITESLQERNRATGFGLSYTASGLASIVSPSVAGIILSHMGGLSVQNMRILFLIHLLIILASYIWISLNLEEIMVHPRPNRSSLRELKHLFRHYGIRRWLAVESLGAFIFGAINPFVMVYAAEVKGASALTLGLMGSAQNLAYTVSSIPLGKLADTIGRKKTIALLRPLLYSSILLLVFAPNETFLILASALRGLTWGAMGAWSSLRMELVESEWRGRWSGVIGLLRGLARTPASLVGGLLWTSISPSAPFLMLIMIDATVRLPLILTMPETLRQG